MLYPVLIDLPNPDTEPMFVVLVPSLPGCTGRGATLESALANAREAILRRLRALCEAGVPLPPLSTARELLKQQAGTPGRALHFIGIAMYRRPIGSDTWHYCRNCSHWPEARYDEEIDPPIAGELCNECRAKETRRVCQL